MPNSVAALKQRQTQYLSDGKISSKEAYNLERLAKDGGKVTADEAAASRQFFEQHKDAFSAAAKSRFEAFMGGFPAPPPPAVVPTPPAQPAPPPMQVDSKLQSLLPTDESLIKWTHPDEIDWLEANDYLPHMRGPRRGEERVLAKPEKQALRLLLPYFDAIDGQHAAHPDWTDGKLGVIDFQVAAADSRLPENVRRAATALATSSPFFQGLDKDNDGLITKHEMMRGAIQNLDGFHAMPGYYWLRNDAYQLKSWLEAYNKNQRDTRGSFAEIKSGFSKADLQALANDWGVKADVRKAANEFLNNPEKFLQADTAHGYTRKDNNAVLPDGFIGELDLLAIYNAV